MIPTDPFKTYKHSNGEAFRVTGVSRNEEPTWVNGVAYHKWMISTRTIEGDKPCKLFFDESDKKYKEVWK